MFAWEYGPYPLQIRTSNHMQVLIKHCNLFSDTDQSQTSINPFLAMFNVQVHDEWGQLAEDRKSSACKPHSNLAHFCIPSLWILRSPTPKNTAYKKGDKVIILVVGDEVWRWSSVGLEKFLKDGRGWEQPSWVMWMKHLCPIQNRMHSMSIHLDTSTSLPLHSDMRIWSSV